MISSDQKVLVVGAGTIGACCAWHLVEKGFRVTLVDRVEPGQSTSYGNAACISPSHVVPFSHPGVWKKIPGWLFDELGPLTIRWRHLPWVAPWLWRFWRAGTREKMLASVDAQTPLMQRAAADFDRTLAQTGTQHYLRKQGLMVVYDRPEQFEADRWIYELEQSRGFDWQPLSSAEAAELAPSLALRKGTALFVPSWQHTVNPGEMTADIARAALSAGADWEQASVQSLHASSNGVSARLAGGRQLTADKVVIAAGAWSNELAGPLDFRVPMTPKRGYHSMIAEPGFELGLPVMSGTRNFVMTPLADGLRLAGTAEFARLDAPPNYRRAQVLVEHAKHYFPDLQPQGVSEWMGQRPMMVDSVPVISRSPARKHVFYAFGHGHYGLTQGATTGQIIAAMVAGEDPGLNLDPYRIDRFGN